MNDSNNINKGSLPGLKEKRYLQKKAIIGFLYRMGELSKPEICRLTNVTTPTVSRMIEELMEEGWVIDRGCGNSIGGKRPHVFSLNPDAAYILGVDVGREFLRIAIFNLQNEPIEGILEYPSILEEQDDNATLKYIKERIDETIERLGVNRVKIKMCGVALPGLIDREGNTYTYLTYERPGVKAILEEMLAMPVFIDNDSNVMAMAEHTFGVAKGINNVLCIKRKRMYRFGDDSKLQAVSRGNRNGGGIRAYPYIRTKCTLPLREDRMSGNGVFRSGYRESGGDVVGICYSIRPEG